MIVATAGHVDHGKTSLVKTLTGIDTDRLPEEKQRGLSIDLGFAYQPLAGGAVLGFVDVPGHERFIANMLAGTSCIDYALLVVAADDGPMPQTREHLAILDLLKVPGGAIALSKTDRVTKQRIAEVIGEVRALVKGTALERAEIFPVSSETSEGTDALRTHLHEAATQLLRRQPCGQFRLAVDRCFTLQGVGVVVTGAVLSGVVKLHDTLVISPGGQEVRVRGMRAQNSNAETAQSGERIAINLVGTKLHRKDVRRGDWLVSPAAHHPTQRIDARISVLKDEVRELGSYTPVHVHIGACDVSGRVVLLEARECGAGKSALAQIILARPVVAAYGDRFILRDQSARRTIGGGSVIDAFPAPRGRTRAQRVAFLKALEVESLPSRLRAALAESRAGLDLQWFGRAMNLTDEHLQRLCAEVSCVCTGKAPSCFAIERSRWLRLMKEVAAVLEELHRRSPEKLGASELELEGLIEIRVVPEVLRHALSALVAADALRQQAGRYFLPGHITVFDSREAALWKRIRPLLEAGDKRPPVVSEIAEELNVSPRSIIAVLDRAVELGLVHRVAPTRFFLPEVVESLAQVAEKLSAERPDGCFEPAAYRDSSGIGRRVSVEMLEYFDRIGLTRRIKNGRKLMRSPSQLFNGRDSMSGGAPGLQNR